MCKVWKSLRITLYTYRMPPLTYKRIILATLIILHPGLNDICQMWESGPARVTPPPPPPSYSILTSWTLWYPSDVGEWICSGNPSISSPFPHPSVLTSWTLWYPSDVGEWTSSGRMMWYGDSSSTQYSPSPSGNFSVNVSFMNTRSQLLMSDALKGCKDNGTT